jgi:hypothetical protein
MLPTWSHWRAATTTNVAMSRCRRCRCRCHCHCRHAAAKLPPTLRCCAAATAPVSALLPPHCRRRSVHRRHALRCRHRRPPRHAAANVALSRCRHRRSLRAAATTLPPSRCVPPPRFALPPPPGSRHAAADVTLSCCLQASALLPRRCRCRAVHRPRALRCRHRRRAAAKLPPTLRCCAAATAASTMPIAAAGPR